MFSLLHFLVFLSTKAIPLVYGGDHFVKELPHCTGDKPGLVLVSTLNGKLSALDSTGEFVWEFTSAPGALLNSSIHNFDLTNHGERIRIIPSLTGKLYKFNGKTIDAIPINADSLLKSSSIYTNGFVIAGGREIRTYGIALATGNCLYECSLDGCKNTTSEEIDDLQDVLLLERSTLVLRSHEPRRGKEIWNVSVAEHNIKMPHSHCIHVDSTISNIVISAVLPDGIVLAHANTKERQFTWKHQFDSPIVDVWTWDGKDLLDIDLFSGERQTEEVSIGTRLPSPAIYLAAHKKQLYIHESRKMLEMIHMVPTSDQKIPQMPRNPIPSATIPLNHDQALALYTNDLDYIHGNGYYLYTEEDNKKGLLCDNTTENPDTVEIRQETDYLQIWVQVLLVTVSASLYYYFFYARDERQRAFHIPMTIQPSETLTITDCANDVALTLPLPPPERFQSRYATDFETVQSLGRGGFGVVFEVLQKIDECKYAIKRITIPDRDQNKDIVMREVRALAKLEHRHIVRYFNSWIEYPSADWLKEHDQKFFSPDDDSCISSYSHSNIPSCSSTVSANSDTTIIDITNDSSGGIVFEHSNCSQDDEPSDNSTATTVRSERKSICISSCSTASNQSVSDLPMKRSLHSKRTTRQSVGKSVCLYIQMQLCQKESLREWLAQCKTRNKTETMTMFGQIISAVQYVHSHGLIHRDLKPNNIFFSQDRNIKIGDFGLVKAMEDVECDVTACNSIFRSHTKEVGTRLYMSPEQAAGKRYNYKVDIYSLGIILFELLIPFDTDSERIDILQKLRKFRFPTCFESSYTDERELLSMMLAENPDERPSTDAIIDVPMISNIQRK